MMRQDIAQTVALQALGWMAADDEVFGAFLGASGATVAEVRARAADPEFLASVLDFLLLRDDWVLGFAESAAMAPDQPMRARMALGGGDMANWT
ncbi:DUF3572 domain-containing protein [Phaeovulum sp.]|uniref:DUF3572 domain-containing protein n=1 Tax=Phaeovulum sp. TaxID=2934796 RepID=UPI0039E53341